MKDYKSPVVLENEELAEGVFTASGDLEGDCWTVDIKSDQDDAGGYHTFRVSGVHSASVTHISTASTVTIHFTENIDKAEFEGFDVSWSGNEVILVRENHANAYYSGDQFNSLLKIWSPNYKSITWTDISIKCTKAVNVQGGFD